MDMLIIKPSTGSDKHFVFLCAWNFLRITLLAQVRNLNPNTIMHLNCAFPCPFDGVFDVVLCLWWEFQCTCMTVTIKQYFASRSGFSYVDNTSLLPRNNDDATADLLAFLWEFFQIHEALRTAPFYIVAESYGGKFASQLGVALQRKRISSTLDFNFQGKHILQISCFMVLKFWVCFLFSLSYFLSSYCIFPISLWFSAWISIAFMFVSYPGSWLGLCNLCQKLSIVIVVWH